MTLQEALLTYFMQSLMSDALNFLRLGDQMSRHKKIERRREIERRRKRREKRRKLRAKGLLPPSDS